MQIARDEPALFVKLLAARLPRETETSGRVIMIGAQPGGRWGMSRLATSITFPNIRERIRRRARPPKVALRAYIVLTRGKWDFAGCHCDHKSVCDLPISLRRITQKHR